MKQLILLLGFVALSLNMQSQTIDPNRDHAITLNDGVKMTKDFRHAHPTTNTGNAFGKTTLLNILGQNECVGIRFYNALDLNGVQHLVAVGVKSDGTDMINGIVADKSICCLPGCDCVTSPLNTD